MSHTWKHGKTIFVGNSDLSGEVVIVNSTTPMHTSVSVPGKDLIAFIAEYVRNQRIAALENADDEMVLVREMP